MVTITSGLVSAVVIFGLVMGVLALQEPLQGNNDDVPLMLYTAPELQQSAFGTTLNSINADSLVIEETVDASGRIQKYRIISDPKDSQDVMPQLKNMLIFTTFHPATATVRPTPGRGVSPISK